MHTIVATFYIGTDDDGNVVVNGKVDGADNFRTVSEYEVKASPIRSPERWIESKKTFREGRLIGYVPCLYRDGEKTEEMSAGNGATIFPNPSAAVEYGREYWSRKMSEADLEVSDNEYVANMIARFVSSISKTVAGRVNRRKDKVSREMARFPGLTTVSMLERR